MPNPATIACPRCGNFVAAGRKFCNKCGGAMAAAAPAAAPSAPRPVSPAPRAAPAAPPPAAAAPPPAAAAPFVQRAIKGGLSIWWLVVPTAIFAILRLILSEQRNVVPVVVVLAAAGGLYWWKQQPLPAGASPMVQRLKPFAYALQIGVVFVMLGGAIAGVALAVVVGFVLFVARNPLQLVHSLEPWWIRQEKLSKGQRKALAFAVPGVIGYFIGVNAAGVEWGATLISITIGAAVAFLFLFTPPDSMRQRRV
jgi:hypothetical protein